MPFNFQKKYKPKGYFSTPIEILSEIILTMHTRIIAFGFVLYLESETPKLVKVKAHTRIIGGKVVKIRPYYRRVWGHKVGTDE